MERRKFMFRSKIALLFAALLRIVTSQAHLEFLLRKKSLLTPESCYYAANSKCLRLTVNSSKIAAAFILSAAVFFSACSKENVEENIYYSPFASENSAYVDGSIYFLLDGGLYRFDEEKLCLEHLGGEEKVFTGASILGNNGNDLLEVNNDLYLEVHKIDTVSLGKEKIIEINARSSTVSYPCFANNYCYYAINPTLPVESEVKVCKVPLDKKITRYDDYEAETLWVSSKPQKNDLRRILQLDADEPYIIFTVESAEDENCYNRLYVYDERSDRLVIDGLDGVVYAGYNDGCVVYINDASQTVEILDIQKDQVISRFPLAFYEKGCTLACDNDYIYINHQEAFIESSAPGRPENSFFYIDIYDYDGNLIGRLDLSDVTEFGKCAQYLCSTDKYIFVGEASIPLCRGLYVVEKDKVKDLEVVELYTGKAQ